MPAAPFGQYARRAGFLYEWLTGQHLDVPDVTNGGYINAISAQHYLTRVELLRIRRWRINNNFPVCQRSAPWCAVPNLFKKRCNLTWAQALRELNQTFGADILMRTASWLTLKESRASFLIEQESDKADRIQGSPT